MDVLLINSPIRVESVPNVIPTGLCIIAAVLINKGHNVEILDVNALRLDRTALESSLKSKRWDVAGISGLITTYEFQQWVSDVLSSSHLHGLVVSGGGLASSVPEFALTHLGVQAIVQGEGEGALVDIVDAVERGSNFEGIPGVGYVESGQVRLNGERPLLRDLDALPFPSWDLIPMDVYLRNPIWAATAKNSSSFPSHIRVKRSMNVITSRGCPHNCSFCYHLFGRSSYRQRSPENVVDEVESLIGNYGVDFIGFVDDNTMASEQWMYAFASLLCKRGIRVHWGCHGRVTEAKKTVLEAMREAGCVWIGYGVESGSSTILKRMHKKATVEQAERAIIETRRAGIFPNTTFIFGYPGETAQTVRETIAFKRKLGIQCGSFYCTPYPGTPLYNEVKEHIPELEAYISSLGNATDFAVNVTGLNHEAFFCLKSVQDRNGDPVECGL